MPGTFAISRPRSSCTTASALGRSLARLQGDEHPADVERRGSSRRRRRTTSRSRRVDCRWTISATCRCSLDIASNETSCAASVKTKICPTSSLGRKPFGIVDEQRAGAMTKTRRSRPSTACWWREHGGQRPAVAARAWHRTCVRRTHRRGRASLRARRLEHPAAQHRRQRQRHEARNQHRDDDRHREFVQQPAEDAAHEQHRDEHRRPATGSSTRW